MPETDHGDVAENPDVRHEPRDVATSAVAWLGGSLLVLGAVVTLGLWWLVHYYDAREKSRDRLSGPAW